MAQKLFLILQKLWEKECVVFTPIHTGTRPNEIKREINDHTSDIKKDIDDVSSSVTKETNEIKQGITDKFDDYED